LRRLFALAAIALSACGELKGLDGPAPPLVSFMVSFFGELAPLRPPGVTDEVALRLAVVWGAPWLTERFCVLPPESDEAAAVIAAGCRDPFGFAPGAVSASVPVKPYGVTWISLDGLPPAEVMVGDVTGRVAYGSLVVFDDRDGTGTLDLARPRATTAGSDSPDIIYGASFVSMTEADLRVAYREGRFDLSSAFYPRSGCLPPEPGFSILGASGFSPAAGLEAIRSGKLPSEDPSSCFGTPAGALTVGVAARPPAELAEVGCLPPSDGGAVSYSEPPSTDPDLADRVAACVHLPASDQPGPSSSLMQLVVSGRRGDRCKGLTHYVLRGCSYDVACPRPDWDQTASPPAWWPCPQ
jgi:hypothetical protein